MDFITNKLIIVFIFMMVITTLETLAYATRLSGARVGYIASSLALFNILIIVSRFSVMIQQPLTGKLITEVSSHDKLNIVATQYRIIIGATTIGTILGILLLPTFVTLFSRAIIQLSVGNGSIIDLFCKWLNFKGLKRCYQNLCAPNVSYLQGIRFRDFPKRLFLINVVVTSVYTIGVLSSLYASLLVPENAAAAIMSSGIINGVATILLTIFIDPKISILADRVVKKQANYLNLKSYSIAMVASKLLGTILAQLLFIPGAHYIAWFSNWI
ncbi:lipid II flippase Amj family protein (plasmid) [Bacillus mycoides]|nr:lipid II flippase Amj family protein [Bacillus mycoides]